MEVYDSKLLAFDDLFLEEILVGFSEVFAADLRGGEGPA